MCIRDRFACYFDVFAFERPQIIGKTEMAYLDSLPEELLNERLKRYFSYDIPCIIIARSMQCPPELLRQAQKNGVPVYGSDEETSIFSAKAITFMSEALAPRQTCHGVLLDVFGVGLMITGESGVGKEIFPRIIHFFSSRKHSPYIAVNCGAIPEGTIDSELFGHEKGAFTGALSVR